MTTIQEKKNQIEKQYEAIQKQYDSIINLESEIDKLETDCDQAEKEYVALIRKAENDKADEFYHKYQELKKSIDAKKNRLETMKRYKKDNVLESWKEIGKIIPGLKQQFMLENEDLIKEYVDAKKAFKNAEDNIQRKGRALEAYISGLEIVQSEQYIEAGVKGFMPLGAYNPFTDQYLESRMNDFK